MSDEFLGDRRKALEEEFFARHNRMLLQRLREGRETGEKQRALAKASGITDETTLAQLTHLGVDSETLAALALVPLVAVAWADGSIHGPEREATLSSAVELGLEKDGPAYQLLEQWLALRPPPTLLTAWKDYIGPFSARLSKDARRAFRQDMLDRARAVAGASGGLLGIGRTISPAEERLLNELGQAIPE